MERTRSFRVTLAILLLGVAVGSAATLVSLKAAGVILRPGLDTSAFSKFLQAYADLRDKYFRPETDQTLLNGAIAGMTNALGDPFTDYFPPADANAFKNMLSGTYVGIGVTVEEVGGQLVIQSVMKGAPAEQAGLKPQDVILKVNGVSVEGMSVDKAASLILGPKGTRVQLTVKRPTLSGRLLDFNVVRAQIARQTVFSRMLPNQVGYLQITVVADQTADEVKQQLADLRKAGARSVIVDLRGNPGGYLDEAVKIAGNFIPQGKAVVMTEDRAGRTQSLTSPGPGLALPVVVIMDKDTASAAEILAAALHDDLGAPLVGTKSFGKGTVQETQTFEDGSSLKYTVAKWLTPDGSWIHGKGLQPTVPVALPSYVSLPPVTQAKLPLRPGQNGSDVEVLQETMRALGYAVDRTDGYYDASTEAAVRLFQQRSGLAQTGIFDQATASRMQAAFDDLLTRSDSQLQKAEQVALQQAR